MSEEKNIKVVTNGNSLPAKHEQRLSLNATPVADIYETNDTFVVALDLPGAQREQIEVLVEPSQLIVRATISDRPMSAGRIVHREIAWNRYEREFKLGPGIDDSRVAAHYEDGVLTVVLPKTDDARARQIHIS